MSFPCWRRGFPIGSRKLWGGTNVLGRKLGARMGLWWSEFTEGAAGLSVARMS